MLFKILRWRSTGGQMFLILVYKLNYAFLACSIECCLATKKRLGFFLVNTTPRYWNELTTSKCIFCTTIFLCCILLSPNTITFLFSKLILSFHVWQYSTTSDSVGIRSFADFANITVSSAYNRTYKFRYNPRSASSRYKHSLS